MYRPNDPSYNLARAAYENVRERNGWPVWESVEAAQRRAMFIRIAREGQHPRKQRYTVRLSTALRAAARAFKKAWHDND